MKEERDPFFVDEYDVIERKDGMTRVRIVWGCSYCEKKFVCYDRPSMDHKEECLPWMISKI